MSDYYDTDTIGEEWVDDDYGAGYAEEPPPGLPYLQELTTEAIREGLETGFEPLRALHDEQQRADAYWADRQARQQYEQEAAYNQQIAAMRPELDALLQQAARDYDSGSTPEAMQRLERGAAQLLLQAQAEARAVGDEEAWAFSNSAEGVRAAISAMAQMIEQRAIMDNALNLLRR